MQDTNSTATSAPEQLDWSPLSHSNGRSNFRARHLVRVDSHRLEVRATIRDRSFSAVFLILGLFALVMSPILFLSEDGGLGLALFIACFAVVFGGMGILLWRRGSRRLIFDRDRAEFWFASSPAPEKRELLTPFEDVLGVQLMSHYARSNKSSWHSHQINLVLHDCERRRVTDQADLPASRRDAQHVAEFLEVELWDRGNETLDT